MKKIIPIISLIIAILTIPLTMFCNNEKYIISILILGIVLNIIAFILAIIVKINLKKEKIKNPVTTATIIISIILCILLSTSLLGLELIKNREVADKIYCPDTELVKNCIDNNDGSSTCKYDKVLTITCTTEILKEEQMKKQEN